MGQWLIWSDLHLDQWRAFATIEPSGLNSRLVEQIHVVKQVKRLARKHNVSNIFFLGDLFNSQTATVHKIVYNVAFYLIQQLAEVAPIYLLVGNHDIFQNINTFTPFTSISGAKVVASSVHNCTIDGVDVDLVPWNGRLNDKTKSAVLFAHFGLRGAVVNKGFVVDDDHAVSLDLLKQYKLVMSGHYHGRQMVAENRYHVGSVMAHSFKDSEEDKGIWLLNTDNLEFRFIPIQSNKFITVPIASEKDVKKFIEQDKTNNYWKVQVQNEGILLPEFENNVAVEYNYVEQTLEDMPVDSSSLKDIKEIIVEFVENSNTVFPKDVLKQKALEVLEL